MNINTNPLIHVILFGKTGKAQRRPAYHIELFVGATFQILLLRQLLQLFIDLGLNEFEHMALVGL